MFSFQIFFQGGSITFRFKNLFHVEHFKKEKEKEKCTKKFEIFIFHLIGINHAAQAELSAALEERKDDDIQTVYM